MITFFNVKRLSCQLFDHEDNWSRSFCKDKQYVRNVTSVVWVISICERPGREKQWLPRGRSAVANGVAFNPIAASLQASSTSMFVCSKKPRSDTASPLSWEQEDQTFSKTQFQNVDNSEDLFLNSIAKIFDPIGILSPMFVAFKELFQDMKDVAWDAPLDEEVL